MIIFGTRGKILPPKPSQIACPSCKRAQMSVHAVQRYLHIYWVPTAPIGKKMFAVCDGCQATIDLAQQSDVVRQQFAPAISQVRTPPWTFAGLAVIAVFACGGYLNSQGEHAAQAEPASMTQTLERGDDAAPAMMQAAPAPSKKASAHKAKLAH